MTTQESQKISPGLLESLQVRETDEIPKVSYNWFIPLVTRATCPGHQQCWRGVGEGESLG